MNAEDRRRAVHYGNKAVPHGAKCQGSRECRKPAVAPVFKGWVWYLCDEHAEGLVTKGGQR